MREAAAHGCGGDDVDRNVYATYRVRLEDLTDFVEALDMPHAFYTRGGHLFTGEEGALLLLRRFASEASANDHTKETGRSESAISECVYWVVEHLHRRFSHLMDERSITCWSPHFAEFAAAFSRCGVPMDNLIGFIDGKLYPVCRPGRYQHVLYSGHKRIHGVKTQGVVFPNGTSLLRHSCSPLHMPNAVALPTYPCNTTHRYPTVPVRSSEWVPTRFVYAKGL